MNPWGSEGVPTVARRSNVRPHPQDVSMFLVCPACSRVHSTTTGQAREPGSVLRCSCGAEIPIPDEPKETFLGKLRDQLGQRLVCGIVGAVLFGGINVAISGHQAWLLPTVSALVGFVLGAALGEKLLAWYERR